MAMLHSKNQKYYSSSFLPSVIPKHAVTVRSHIIVNVRSHVKCYLQKPSGIPVVKVDDFCVIKNHRPELETAACIHYCRQLFYYPYDKVNDQKFIRPSP